MERAGQTPQGGIRPGDLVALADRAGPFATVWLGRSGTGGWGEQADDSALPGVLSALERAGASRRTADAVAAAIASTAPDARGVVLVADGSGVLLAEELPQPPRSEVARWSPLPSLAAALEHRQSQIRAVVVLADRIGADIVVAGPDGGEVALNVEGDDRPITKSAPGGWSQRRFQQRAEDSWEHNAAGVADRIQRLAAEMFPELVVIGGDERAVELISGRLPDDLRSVMRTIAPGRAADGSEDQRDEQIDRLMNNAVAEQTVGLLRAFEEQEGQEARGVNGVDATLEALQRSQVDVLLVHDDADDDRHAWFSAQPGMVAMHKDDLEDLGVSAIVEARVVDVAINAALRTGAAVRVVPDAAAIDGGMAAILRWS